MFNFFYQIRGSFMHLVKWLIFYIVKAMVVGGHLENGGHIEFLQQPPYLICFSVSNSTCVQNFMLVTQKAQFVHHSATLVAMIRH